MTTSEPPAPRPAEGLASLPAAPPAPMYRQGAYPNPYAMPMSTNGMAIASMVLGILWLYWIGSILALVFGYLARAEIKRNGQSGDGMAVAGIVLGWVGVGILAGVLVSFGAAASFS